MRRGACRCTPSARGVRVMAMAMAMATATTAFVSDGDDRGDDGHRTSCARTQEAMPRETNVLRTTHIIETNLISLCVS